MCNAIYFDMDGTIADLYNVRDWEIKLRAQDPSPYEQAEPMHDMQKLNAILEKLQALGVVVGVISWLAMESSKDYDKVTRQAKKEWIKKYLPCVTEMHLVKYGTPKHHTCKIKENAILIDDNAEVCRKWNRGETINPNCEDFMEKMESLLQKQAA